MKQKITDSIIDNVSILAKLELSEAERLKAKTDMEQMLEFIDILNEVNIDADAGSYHEMCELREDIVTNGYNSEAVLRNAPAIRDSMFVVPKTI